jgi:KipI family sensor histidine kinase inhibitor
MIEQVSVDSLLLRLADSIDPALPARLASICDLLEADGGAWLVDLVPSYTTLLVTWDPLQTDYQAVRNRVMNYLSESAGRTTEAAPRLHRIPVWYSTDSGPDLEAVARHAGLSVDEVIRIHSETRYQVYALGFAPGFAFLGETDERIVMPRKQTPRTRVPAGSVAIANRQTAIYPLESPGGWQLIGLSPVRLFDPQDLSLLKTGDTVQFYPITESGYREMAGGMS